MKRNAFLDSKLPEHPISWRYAKISKHLISVLLTLLTLGLMSATAIASQVPVNLGTAGNFVILTKSGIATTGTTSIVGNIGASPIAAGGITGFGLIMDASNQFATSSLVTGSVYASDYAPPTPSTMTTAVADMETAYTDAAGRSLPDFTELGAGNIGGMTLTAGLYKWGTGVLIPPGGVTLSGSPSDVWIFQIAQDLTVNNGAIITLSGGAQAKNVFWQVAGKATLGTTVDFKGIILSRTLISLNTGATLNGRALAQTAVTLIANAVTAPTSLPSNGTPDLNGEGKSDLIWYNAATGQTAVWLMNGTSVLSNGGILLSDPNWKVTATADFDGDGKSDFLWYNAATGQTAIWLMNGTAVLSNSGILLADPNWKVTATADFNGDGKSDFLWYNAATGQTAIWLMNGTAVLSNSGILRTDPNWKVTAAADFNSDGKSDFLWYNAATGQTAIWLMNGTAVLSNSGVLMTDPNWKVTATADFNGDGKSDFLWYNAATGQTAIWLMNGTAVLSNSGILLADPNWKVTAAADFNGDGKSDFLWYNAATGQTAIWLMNGTAVLSNSGVLLADPNWKVTAAADFNGDRKSDFLWYNAATGQTAIWLMNGTAVLSNSGILLTDPNWKVTQTGQ